MRPISASVRLGALSHNLSVVRALAPRSKVWAVVKANAYGHGLDRLMPALESADGLAMLEVDAALNLKKNGERRPILLLEGFFSPEELSDVASSGLIPVVHSLEQVAMLEGTHVTRPVDIYMKLNSGMNRLGFAPDVARSTLARLRATGKIGTVTAMTHFADADGNRGVAEQMSRTRAILAGLGESAPVPCSFANSAAILGFPDTHADWVRPGIMLYGCSPFGDAVGANAGHFGLQPVMTLQSRIIAVQSLVAGDRVGYGGIFTAQSSMRIGIAACGYADGYPRHAPGGPDRGTPVLVDGHRCRTVGRVSMDMLFVDLSHLASAGVGSRVTLWGDGLSADEVAAAAGTVSYELLCALASRVPVEVLE